MSVCVHLIAMGCSYGMRIVSFEKLHFAIRGLPHLEVCSARIYLRLSLLCMLPPRSPVLIIPGTFELAYRSKRVVLLEEAPCVLASFSVFHLVWMVGC